MHLPISYSQLVLLPFFVSSFGSSLNSLSCCLWHVALLLTHHSFHFSEAEPLFIAPRIPFSELDFVSVSFSSSLNSWYHSFYWTHSSFKCSSQSWFLNMLLFQFLISFLLLTSLLSQVPLHSSSLWFSSFPSYLNSLSLSSFFFFILSPFLMLFFFPMCSFLVLLIFIMFSSIFISAMTIRFNVMSLLLFYFFVILFMAVIRSCRSSGIQTVSEGVCPWLLRCHHCNVLRTIERMNLQRENEVGWLHNDRCQLKMFRTPQKFGPPFVYPRGEDGRSNSRLCMKCESKTKRQDSRTCSAGSARPAMRIKAVFPENYLEHNVVSIRN